MVNLHTCDICGETIYFIPVMSDMGRVKNYIKMNPDKKKHVCNNNEEFESFYQDHDLSARKFYTRSKYPDRRARKF